MHTQIEEKGLLEPTEGASPEENDPDAIELYTQITEYNYNWKRTGILALKETLQGLLDDYPGAVGYVMGQHHWELESLPKERWALLSNVARDLFKKGLDPKNWSGFTKITAPRASRITDQHNPHLGIGLGQVFNLAVESRCPGVHPRTRPVP